MRRIPAERMNGRARDFKATREGDCNCFVGAIMFCTELGCITACTLLYQLCFILEEDGDGEISISLNRKLNLESVLAREISEREKIWISWIIACGW